MGGVVKKAKKLVRKAIPKEIKPALPYIAAYYGGPLLAGKSAFLTPAVSKALIAGTTSAIADERGNPLRAAALAATPDLLQSGLGNIGSKLTPQTTQALKASLPVRSGSLAVGGANAVPLSQQLGSLATAASESDLMTSLVSPKGQTLGAQAKALAIPTAIEGGAQLAQIQQDQIDEYNRQLQEQGVMNKVKRRQGIYDIYISAGYDPDYVNSVLDKYGYADGGIAYLANGGNPRAGRRSRGTPMMTSAMKKFYGIEDEEEIKLPKKKPEVIEIAEGEEIETDDKGNKIIRSKSDLARGLTEAASGIEAAFGTPFAGVAPAEFKRFAKGGEVEEEEVSESGIMTVASAPNNFAELNMLAIDLFGRPYDQLTDGEQETLMDFVGSKSQAGGEGIMQMASGYKSDIEEMYEQYVFEMEEMGLQPMSFSEFLARERAGMKDGGKAQRRKKGEPADEVIEREQEIFIDTMPKPKRQGIMEAADGGIMEKDMRGGGFIPEGSKERADDVPARLSKNEFVMTADAVRAAGGGSVNKGAKRMYDLMYTLEGKI